jgi:hypothetical protein
VTLSARELERRLARFPKKQMAQFAVIERLLRGDSILEAMEYTGRGRETWKAWRKRDDWFRERVDGIRSRQSAPLQPAPIAVAVPAPHPADPPTEQPPEPPTPRAPVGSCESCGAQGVQVVRWYSGQLRCLDRAACVARRCA